MNQKKRIFYFDALRALAIILIILTHVFGPSNKYVKGSYSMFPPFNWFAADFVANALIIGVPLFLMLSGALLLGREWDIKSFLKGRVTRIVYPFILWVIVSSVIICLVSQFGPVDLDVNFLNLLYTSVISKGYFYHIWFFWMIVGTYLIMPIFNKWILHSDLRELEYFLVIWLITCIFDFTLSSITFPISLTYFTSPIGLVVLGYYLRYTDRKIFKNKIVSLLLIIIPVISLMFISYLLSDTSQIYKFDRYCIFVALEAMGVFLLFKNSTSSIMVNPRKPFRKIIESISRYSYGIYLVHVPLMCIALKIIPYDTMGYKKWILLLFCITFFSTYLLLYISTKIPFIKEINGVK